MIERHTGIKIALAAMLAGAIGLPGLAAARGDGGWGDGQRGNWGQGQGGRGDRGHADHWRGGREEGRWDHHGPRRHSYGHRDYDRSYGYRDYDRHAPGFRRPVLPVPPLPVITPWRGLGNDLTVILRGGW